MKKTLRVISLLIALVMCLAVVLAACDKVTTVTVTPRTATVAVGESVVLTGAASDGSALTWTSSDESVATVSANGVVTGVSAGTATITAASGDIKGTCVVTVTGGSPEPEYDFPRITLSSAQATLVVGGTKQIKATASNGSAIDSWISSDEQVATVSNSGLITAIKAGNATVTVKSGELVATIAVSVYASENDFPKTQNKKLIDTVVDHTYNDYTSTVPSLWNELQSTDNNNSQIMNYIMSGFFQYEFLFEGDKKYNDDGSINAAGIIPGKFETKFDAVIGLEDATAQYGSEWGLTAKQIEGGKYIWRLTLRNDLAWDDGTSIFAEDFVYSMKEQLNPLFQNARADEYYVNAVKLHNARDYFYQGSEGWVDNNKGFSRELLVKGADGIYKLNGDTVVIPTTRKLGWLGATLAQAIPVYSGQYFDAEAGQSLLAIADSSTGDIPVTDESIALLERLITTYPAWGETTEDIVNYMYYYHIYPAVNFDDVGIFAESPYDLILVLDSPLNFFKEDGQLSYNAAYSFGGLPLVKKDLYEACKVAPQSGSTLWTSTYNTTLETSASWGPYKLSQYQAGNSYTLSRNEYWYGYALEENRGMYQTDQIKVISIKDEAPAQLEFWAGQVDGLGISVTIADQYKNSKYAMFSPRVANFAINLYSNLDVLKVQGRNNGILAIKDFREALSLSLDRASYNRELTTANKPLLGFLGEDYYYDIENGEVYRYSTQGKEALLRTYGFAKNEAGKWYDIATNIVYDDIDEAVEAMTGYNLTLAKQKFASAWTELTTHAEQYGYDPTKNITLLLGASEPSAAADREKAWIQRWIDTLIEGSGAEGKIKVELNANLGEAWSEEFEVGNYDICTGGFGNAPFNPFYMISCVLGDLSIGFHGKYWLADEVEITYTMPAGDYEGAGQELTLTMEDWYNSLNGNMSLSPSYNWGDGFAPVEVRLEVLAMLEEYALKEYYSLPTSRGFTSALRSAKFHYITEEYNTMLKFGGMAYMQYDYTDAEWTAFVAENGGDLRNFYRVSE